MATPGQQCTQSVLKMLKPIMIFFTVFFLQAFSNFAYASIITADVDRDELAINESIRLIVTVDESASSNIDFSELSLQFDIQTTRRSIQTSIVNGKVSAKTQWIIILTPKETGKLIIPSFNYNSVFSQAIPITVVATKAQNSIENAGDQDVFLEVSVNKKTLYVQEQLLVTMRLYYRTPLSSYDDEELKVENATMTLASETNTNTTYNGRGYTLLEKIYAIHPQSSGELIIPGQSWRLEKALSRFNFGPSVNPYLFVKSSPIIVSVNPININSTAKTWLPSTKVTLDSKWKQSILQAKVGEPLNYQLILIANGLTGAQLPDISLRESDHFTVYTEKATTKDTKSSAGIIGTRINNFAIIPKKAGSFTFPASTLKWWNTKKNKEEIAVVAEQTIVVSNVLQEAENSLPTLDTAADIIEPAKTNTIYWVLLSLFFAVCFIVLTFLIKRKNNKKAVNKINIKHNKIQKFSYIYQKIEDSILHEEWVELYSAIIDWANLVKRSNINYTTADISDSFPEIADYVEALNTAIYSENKEIDIDANELIGILKNIENKKKQKKIKNQGSGLQNLYQN